MSFLSESVQTAEERGLTRVPRGLLPACTHRFYLSATIHEQENQSLFYPHHPSLFVLSTSLNPTGVTPDYRMLKWRKNNKVNSAWAQRGLLKSKSASPYNNSQVCSSYTDFSHKHHPKKKKKNRDPRVRIFPRVRPTGDGGG